MRCDFVSTPCTFFLEIVLGKRGITTDAALRLSRYFGTSAQVWAGLQTRYDLEVERERVGKRLEKEVKVLAAAG